MKIKRATPELIFVLYIFGFATIRPILLLFKAFSSVIIAAYIAVILLISLFNDHVFEEKCFIKWAIVSVLFEILLYFGRREISATYMVNFFMYGIVALFLLINVNNYQRVIHWVVKFSCVNGAVLILDPFFSYQLNGGYMPYGFNMLMLSFTGLLFGYFYYKNRLFLVPMIIELIMISFYGNKGAAIAAFFLLFVAMILSGSDVKKLFYSLIACLGILSWRSILLLIIDVAQIFGVTSYSIKTLKIMLSDKSDIVFSARTNIWEKAINWILEKPILGHRVGEFEAATDVYAHNIFLDISLSFGLVGLIIFLILLLHSIYKMRRNPCKEYKLFQLCCLLCWLIPMQISLTLWNVSLFWVYWGLYLYDNKYKRQKIKSISIDKQYAFSSQKNRKVGTAEAVRKPNN